MWMECCLITFILIYEKRVFFKSFDRRIPLNWFYNEILLAEIWRCWPAENDCIFYDSQLKLLMKLKLNRPNTPAPIKPIFRQRNERSIPTVAPRRKFPRSSQVPQGRSERRHVAAP